MNKNFEKANENVSGAISRINNNFEVLQTSALVLSADILKNAFNYNGSSTWSKINNHSEYKKHGNVYRVNDIIYTYDDKITSSWVELAVTSAFTSAFVQEKLISTSSYIDQKYQDAIETANTYTNNYTANTSGFIKDTTISQSKNWVTDNFYNKSTVDQKIAGAFKFMGKMLAISEDETEITDEDGNIIKAAEQNRGHIYQLINSDKEYASDSEKWVLLGYNIDLSAYALSADVHNEIITTKNDLIQNINLKADKTYTDSQLTYISGQVDLKADKTYTDNQLTYISGQIDLKADKTYTDSQLTYISGQVDLKADKTYTDSQLTYISGQVDLKADKTYTDSQLTYISGQVDLKADKTYTDNQLTYISGQVDLKADKTYTDNQDTKLSAQLSGSLKYKGEIDDLKNVSPALQEGWMYFEEKSGDQQFWDKTKWNVVGSITHKQLIELSGINNDVNYISGIIKDNYYTKEQVEIITGNIVTEFDNKLQNYYTKEQVDTITNSLSQKIDELTEALKEFQKID